MASAVIGALRVVLGLDSAQFADGLTASQRKLAQFNTATVRALSAVAVAGVAAAASITRSSMQTIDAQLKLAQRLGSSVAGVQALAHAGDLADVSFETLSTASDRLNRTLGEVARTGSGPAFNALRRLGLTAEQLSNLDADDRLALIADRMHDAGYSAAQMADTLGKLGIRQAELANLFVDGGAAIRGARQEIEHFGIAVDDIDARRIEEANDALTRVGLAVQGLGNRLAVELAPNIQKIADYLTGLVVDTDAVSESATALGLVLAGVFGAALAGRIALGVAAVGAFITQMRTATITAVGFRAALGPIGLALGIVAAAVSLFADADADAAEAARIHEDAVRALNDELADTRGVGSTYITARADQRQADLDAAEATLTLMRARIEALRLGGFEQYAGDPNWRERMATDMAMVDGLQTQVQRVADLQMQVEGLRGQARRSWFLETIMGQNLPDAPGTTPPNSPTEADQTEQDAMEKRLQTLQESLDNEQEAEDRSYQERVAQLREFIDAGIVDAKEAAQIKERIEREHQANVTRITEEGEKKRRELREQAVSAVADIMGSISQIIGEGSERAFKIAKAFAIGEALINVAQGVTKALAGPFPFINAAKIAVAGAAQIASIRRQQPGGGSVTPVPSGGGGSTGGDSGGGSSEGAAAPQQVQIHLSGGPSFSEQQIRDLIVDINRAQPNGPKIQVYA